MSMNHCGVPAAGLEISMSTLQGAQDQEVISCLCRPLCHRRLKQRGGNYRLSRGGELYV